MNAVSTGPAASRPAARIWFAIFGAPLAWSVQEVVGWLLADFACDGSAGASGALSATALRAAAIVVSAAALAVAVAALLVGLNAWRHSTDRHVVAVRAATTPDFLAAAALFVSVSFTLGILWAGMGPVMLPLCERVL